MADINVEIDLKGFEELKNLGKMVQQLRQNLNAQTTSIKQGFEGLWKQLENVSAKGGRQAGSRASNAFLSELRKVQYGARSILAGLGLQSLGGGSASIGGFQLGSVFGPAGALVGAIAGGIIDGIVKASTFIYRQVRVAFQTAADVEDTRLAYSLHGGVRAGNRQFGDVAGAPLNRKFTPVQLAQALIPALSAGFTDNQLKNVANSSVVAAKATRGAGYGLSDISEFAERFAAVQLREGLSRRQLVGFGIVNADQFFTTLAKSMQDAGVATKVTAKDAEALAKDGKHADFVIRQLHLAIRAMADSVTGGGRGGLAAIETLGDVWNKTTTIPLRLYQELAGDSSGRYGKLKDSLRRFYGKFFDDAGGLTGGHGGGQELLEALGKGLSTIVDVIGDEILTPSNIQAFAEGVVAIIRLVNEFVVSFAKIGGKAVHVGSSGFGGGTWAQNVLKFTKDVREGGWLHAIWEREKAFYGFGGGSSSPTSAAGGVSGMTSSSGIPDLTSLFRKGHTGKNALPWSPEALPSQNLGVTGKPAFVDSVVHSPQYHMTFNGSVEPDKVRDAVIEGNRQAIKEFEAAVQQNGGF